MIILGIDPDRGWAVVDHNRDKPKVLAAGSEKGLLELLKRVYNLHGVEYEIDLVRIELPNHRHIYDRPRANKRQMMDIAVKVGENRGKAEAIYHYCREFEGLQAELVQPVKNGTKLSAKQIEGLTGWEESTDEHARDAIVLAYVRG